MRRLTAASFAINHQFHKDGETVLTEVECLVFAKESDAVCDRVECETPNLPVTFEFRMEPQHARMFANQMIERADRAEDENRKLNQRTATNEGSSK